MMARLAGRLGGADLQDSQDEEDDGPRHVAEEHLGAGRRSSYRSIGTMWTLLQR